MSKGPSKPSGPGTQGSTPSYLPTPQQPSMGTYGAGYQQPQGTNVGYAQMQPWQQGLQQGDIKKGMGMLTQDYSKMGDMANTFAQNAQNAGNSAYNPAIGAYQSAMNQNSQNIGAQLASQRGSSQDPGLAARNVGQAGAMAAQAGAGQMAGQVAQYKMGNQQAQANAYQAQGQMANMYSQAGLANQGQQLNAIAAQNAANVAMQSNVNSSNVAMQSNINSSNVAMQSNYNDVMAQQMMNNNNIGAEMYGMQLGYNSNMYGSYMQGQSQSPGLFGGHGFLGLFAEGGEVGKPGHGKIVETTGRTIGEKKAAFTKALAGVPKYAKGGRIPEARRKKMAEGGYVKRMDDGGQAGDNSSQSGPSPYNLGVNTCMKGGCDVAQKDQALGNMGSGGNYSLGTNLNLMQALQQNSQQQANQNNSSAQAPASTVGKIMSGLMAPPQIHPAGGGGDQGSSMIMGGLGNMMKGGSFMGGAGSAIGGGGPAVGGGAAAGGDAAAGAGAAGAGDAAALAAAAHGGRIGYSGGGGVHAVAKVPHVRGIGIPGIHNAAKGGHPGAAPIIDHGNGAVSVPKKELGQMLKLAQIGLMAIKQAQGQGAQGAPQQGQCQQQGMPQGGCAQQNPPMARGGQVRRYAQGAIVPQTQNPNMPGSMTPNIAMQSYGGGLMGGGGPPQSNVNNSNVAMQGGGGQSNVNNSNVAMQSYGSALGGGQSNVNNVQGQGPSMANFALAGSPNQSVAMPSTGMPMGNAQTAGGGPMPSQGASGNVMCQAAQQQMMQRMRKPGMPPGMAHGGRVNPYGRSR